MEDAYGSFSWNSWSMDVVDSGSDNAKKNNIVKGLLFQLIQEDLVLYIRNLKTEKEMWEAIKTRNLGADRVKEVRLQTLITEFENLKMLDNGTIEEYTAKLSGIASKSATLGEVMSEHKLVKKSKRDYEANLNETYEGDVNHEEGTFFMMNHIQETIFMNEENYTPPKSESNTDDKDDVWYFDNGASNHMTGKNGEQNLLKDVYYIPALRSNVISLGQATISGYNISIRAARAINSHMVLGGTNELGVLSFPKLSSLLFGLVS
nr:uncharacterized protein [Tanacetum cinerariifolium]